MATYSLGVRSSGTASGAALWELRTGASFRVKIMEIGIAMAAATASVFGLGRPAAIGVTPTSPVTLLAEDPAEGASSASVSLAWGTGPTAPTGTNYLRRIGLPATIGAAWVWSWSRGLIVPVSSSMVLYNLQLNGVADIYVVTDE